MSDAPSPVIETAEHRFPCEACGADMRYDPGARQLICAHCGNTHAIEDPSGPWGGTTIRELDFDAALRDRLDRADLEDTRVFHCSSCGAEVEFDPQIHASDCPFCASPIVGAPSISRHIKPKALLPFALDETAARAAMTRWLGKLWFAPNGLQDFARKGRRMDGIYLPHWTFDAQTHTRYTGQRGIVVSRPRRGPDGKTVMQMEVRWFPAHGQVRRFFDDVLVPGSRSLPRQDMDDIAPWDLSQLAPYAPEYLAGFRAEAYGVPLDEAHAQARQKMDRIIERDVRFDIGGDRQRITSLDSQVSDVTFKHVLLPIWVAVYRFQGKPYRILINAQTGRVAGERPWSAVKIAIAAVLVALIGGGLAYLFALQQGGGY